MKSRVAICHDLRNVSIDIFNYMSKNSCSRTPASLRVAQLFLLIAMTIAGYLAYLSLTGSQAAGCGPEQGCGIVLSSKWASILGYSVSLPGFVLYAVVLIMTLVSNVQKLPAKCLVQGLCMVIVFGAIWFTGVQAFILKSFCKYCCATHAVAYIAALIVLKHTLRTGSCTK